MVKPQSLKLHALKNRFSGWCFNDAGTEANARSSIALGEGNGIRVFYVELPARVEVSLPATISLAPWFPSTASTFSIASGTDFPTVLNARGSRPHFPLRGGGSRNERQAAYRPPWDCKPSYSLRARFVNAS